MSSIRVIESIHEDWGDGVAFAAANAWLVHIALGFAAVGFYFDDPAEKRKRALDVSFESQMRAGISQKDVRDRAIETQIPAPALGHGTGCQQATFFFLSTAIVITVEITAFFPSWSSHVLI